MFCENYPRKKELWFDVERRYKTIAEFRLINRISCGLM